MHHHDFDPKRDMASVTRILAHGFGGSEKEMGAWIRQAGAESFRVVSDKKVTLGTYLQVPMGQFFGGRSVKMVGIAGVAVDLASRGRGVGRFMMESAVRELGDRGVALSTLYPATQVLYRRAGYERAGKMVDVTLPTDAFAAQPDGTLIARELTARDEASVVALYQRLARSRPGYLDRGPYIWTRVRAPRRSDGRPAIGFGFFDPGGALHAYAYFVVNADDKTGFFAIRFTDVQASTRAGYATLVGWIASLRSMGRTVSFRAEPSSPLLMMLAEPRYTETSKEDWMLRIVDVRQALLQRGYPKDLTTRVTLGITDPLVEKNQGAFTLSVSGGRGKVTRGVRPDIELGVHALAPLYSGYLDPHGLEALGLLTGKPAALARAEAIFGGGAPGMCEMF
jgi:predicted acetyltransferase